MEGLNIHTPSLTHSLTGVSALALGLQMTKVTRTRVDDSGLLDHETILDQLADVLARVGIGDLVDLIGVEPHLSLSALEHRGSESSTVENE